MPEINVEEINLHINAVYIVKDGKIETIEGPPNGYGKQTVTWQQGKPSHIDFHYTKKI
ncbi:DUF3954 domain-containing protein [Sporosarcina sp. ANT_H38]|uniref:DUF3954 domain-containing protein n=1 Tax=Sporosarcina sp. ANT_H38 TaxID=2597358 RepID=UPI0011F1D153|nr:DUF3954 domain-containing protein [Sporosarcina sp. ANT_H38]KAA0944167.1 DUF3954 domain-containing protein [Sporosarcina sp. ANT_H38]